MLPNLLIVGAAKSGTTSMANFLNKSQNIFIPDIKECRFFSGLGSNFVGLGAEKFINQGIRKLGDYSQLYNQRNEAVLADCSNDYLYYYQSAIPKILDILGPETKIIIILRNPAHRAFSNYCHHLRDGWEDISFKQALLDESQRKKDYWAWSYHYSAVGFYHNSVKAYLDNFKNTKVILFEELTEEVRKDSFYEFLGIENDLVQTPFGRDNISGEPKWTKLRDFMIKETALKRMLKLCLSNVGLLDASSRLARFIKNKNISPVSMSESDYNQLIGNYRNDIILLADLLNRDLNHWLKYEG